MDRVYVDFMKTDDEGRLRLKALGTVEDMRRLGITPSDGLTLQIYSDDLDERGRPDPLVASATFRYNSALNEWVLELPPGEVMHASDLDEPPRG